MTTTELSLIPVAKPIIGREERDAVDAVMASGHIASGPQVAEFEVEFAAQLTAGRTCVAVNSGTSALHLLLLAAGVGPGDEVIVPSFTFAATANSVALAGATPVFVDIEPRHFCLSPAAVEAAVTERTVGIMPVHLFGHPAAMTDLQSIAERHGLAIFEDAAQAHGATWQGSQVGTLGLLAAFSLYPTKNMTSGEGGMVTCGDKDLARSVRLLRNQGMERQYANELVGLNNRMTDIHAAIGRTQLRKLEGWTSTRRENAAFYDEHLAGVTTPEVAEGATHVYHQYTIRVPEGRDEFARRLRADFQVGTGVYYPIPNHRLESLSRFAPNLDLPVTEEAAEQVLSLPVHPSLSQHDLERVVEAVNTLSRAGS